MPKKSFILMTFLAAFPAAARAAPATPGFDGRPEEPADVLEAGETPQQAAPPRPEPAAGPRKPEKLPEKPRKDAKDPRAGRDFRRIRPKLPLGPACPDGGDPPCAREKPYPSGSPPRGGYYYGFYRDARDNKLKYGKLYIPHYGPFDGQAHNDPPDAQPPPPVD